MASVLGVALEAGVVRAALKSRGRVTVLEIPWDSTRPDVTVQALRAKFGTVSEIAISVGLAYLEIAKPELPPLASRDTRRVMLRDSDRYFPTERPVAISVPGSQGLAFATLSEPLHEWVRNFGTWAPVTSVVAGPLAIAASVSAVHRAVPGVVRTLGVDCADGEIGVLWLRDGAVVDVRRIPAPMGDEVPPGIEPLSEVLLPGAPGVFAAALGAAALVRAPLEGMLLDNALETTLHGQRSRRQWASIALLTVAAILVVASLDARRDAVLARTSVVRDSLLAAAVPARESRARLDHLKFETDILTARQSVRDPLHVVSTLSTLLPADVFVERLSWDGTEWRMDGSADRAASIVPSLDSGAAFSDVRVLSASTRFRDGTRMRESFAVAFRARGDSVAKR